MDPQKISATEALLQKLAPDTLDTQEARLKEEGLEPIPLEALGEVRPSEDYDIVVTNAIVGVPGDLPIGRLYALTESLQYVYDLALWVKDPYAFQVPNLSSADSSRLRKTPRAAYGYETRVSRLHYGSDPEVGFVLPLAIGYAARDLVPFLQALYPYVQSVITRRPKALREAQQERDIAVLGAETAEAKLRAFEAEQALREKQAEEGERVRNRKIQEDRPTTLDRLSFDSEDARKKEALRQVEIVKIELRTEIFGE